MGGPWKKTSRKRPCVVLPARVRLYPYRFQTKQILMKEGQTARTMACDRVELAIGISQSGKRSVLMTPLLRGQPLLPHAIALSGDEARAFASELLRKADLLDQAEN
jgi:hypothetical protein